MKTTMLTTISLCSTAQEDGKGARDHIDGAHADYRRAHKDSRGAHDHSKGAHDDNRGAHDIEGAQLRMTAHEDSLCVGHMKTYKGDPQFWTCTALLLRAAIARDFCSFMCIRYM